MIKLTTAEVAEAQQRADRAREAGANIPPGAMLLSREQTAAAEAADYSAEGARAARKPFAFAGVLSADALEFVNALADKLRGEPDRLSAVCELLRARGMTLGGQQWPDSSTQPLHTERTAK